MVSFGKSASIFLSVVIIIVGGYLVVSAALPGVQADEPEVAADKVEQEAEETEESIELIYEGLGSVTWEYHLEEAEEVQLTWSLNPNPEYPAREGDMTMAISGEKSSTSIEPFEGDGVYYVRMCKVVDGECVIYSQEVQANFGSNTEPRDGTAVNPLDQPKVSLFHSGGNTVNWTVNGVVEQGVKIVWSKFSAPTYPTDDNDRYIYINTQTSGSTELYGFDGAGTYYVRACEYTGSGCASYSNQITVDLEAEEDEEVEEQKGEKVEEDEDKKEDKKTETTSEVSSISLWSNGGTAIGWSVSGTSSQGFKLVWSKTSGPTYPLRSGDKYQYYSSASATSGSISAFDGDGLYYVRVCEYLGGKCGVYSNEITVSLDDGVDESESVASISLWATGGGGVAWSADGVSAKGFKVVWSKTSGPTYPTRSTDKYTYLSSSSASASKVTAFDGAGTYYVRVCEYLGGACGVYSNQITVEL